MIPNICISSCYCYFTRKAAEGETKVIYVIPSEHILQVGRNASWMLGCLHRRMRVSITVAMAMVEKSIYI